LNAWKQEKENKILQHLPDNFLREMKKYVTSTEIDEEESNDIQVRISKQEINRAKMMLEYLINLRLKKIVSAEIQGIPITTSYMTTEEQHLQTNLRKLLLDYFSKTEILPLKKKPTHKKKRTSTFADMKKETQFMILRFLKPLPAIMGTDLKAYGPFKPEDVASIPYENALNLIRRGIAKEVKIEP
jgi:DNA replication factor GINS